jgi:hypothetical protein
MSWVGQLVEVDDGGQHGPQKASVVVGRGYGIDYCQEAQACADWTDCRATQPM